MAISSSNFVTSFLVYTSNNIVKKYKMLAISIFNIDNRNISIVHPIYF